MHSTQTEAHWHKQRKLSISTTCIMYTLPTLSKKAQTVSWFGMLVALFYSQRSLCYVDLWIVSDIHHIHTKASQGREGKQLSVHIGTFIIWSEDDRDYSTLWSMLEYVFVYIHIWEQQMTGCGKLGQQRNWNMFYRAYYKEVSTKRTCVV